MVLSVLLSATAAAIDRNQQRLFGVLLHVFRKRSCLLYIDCMICHAQFRFSRTI